MKTIEELKQIIADEFKAKGFKHADRAGNMDYIYVEAVLKAIKQVREIGFESWEVSTTMGYFAKSLVQKYA